MKFAKELDEELVPEWRAKYLNYKLGKKKIKAISRVLQKAGGTPLRRLYDPSQVPSFHRLPPNTSTSVAQFPLDYQSSSYYGSPSQQTAGVRLPEQRPLRTAGSSRFSNIEASYGSIVSEPPQHGGSDLPSLALPDPAIDPGQVDDIQQRPQDAAPPMYASRPSKATLAPSPRARSHSLLPKNPFSHRVGSTVEDGYSKRANFFRRVFTSGDLESPGKSYQSSLYSEVAQREDEFFQFLDGELYKIETFYLQKEREATERLQALRRQLHLMRDQRTAQLLNAKGNFSSDRDQPKNSHYLGIVPSAKWTGAIVGKHRFGKNSRALADLRTPRGPAPIDLDAPMVDRRDFVRRPESLPVPYRTAKRKLKLAVQEFYRGLELLKAYAYLNRKAFRKINKKYDKVTNMRPTLRYMSDKVNRAYFVSSEIIEGHMAVVEDLYARYFESGNRKIAVGKLRGKTRPDDYSAVTFRSGLLLSAGIVGCIQGVILSFRFSTGSDPILRLQASYLLQIYAGYFLIVFHFLLFCLDCMIWTRSKINYAFVFEFDTRHALDWRQLSELPCLFFLLLGLFMWINFSWANSMFIYYPVVLIAITVLVLFFPARVLYHHSRAWWAFSNWRLLLAGLYPVEFRDFFLGDMYCSQTYTMGNIELFFCLYATGWSSPPTCNSSHSRLLGFFTALPSVLRGFQCLRRYRDTNNVFPHLVNFGKYTFGMLYYMSLSLYRITPNRKFQAIFIVFAFINAGYTSVWDLAMDWSLGNVFSSHRFLRDLLGFRYVWIYYVAMVLDVVVRFNWVFYAIFIDDIQHSAVLSFAIALSEVCRRGMWTLFRVENEHCTNVHLFRALRDIPLPYAVKESTTAGDFGAGAINLPPPEEIPPARTASTSAVDGADLESATLPGKTPTLRARRPTFSRVGTLMATAHSQDFQRKRPTDPLSTGSSNSELPGMDDDDSTDEDTELTSEPPSQSDAESFIDEPMPSPAVYRDSPAGKR